PNSVMSAPAMKVRPFAPSTIAFTPASAAARLKFSKMPSRTSCLSAFTGGLSTRMTATSPSRSKLTGPDTNPSPRAAAKKVSYLFRLAEFCSAKLTRTLGSAAIPVKFGVCLAGYRVDLRAMGDRRAALRQDDRAPARPQIRHRARARARRLARLHLDRNAARQSGDRNARGAAESDCFAAHLYADETRLSHPYRAALEIRARAGRAVDRLFGAGQHAHPPGGAAFYAGACRPYGRVCRAWQPRPAEPHLYRTGARQDFFDAAARSRRTHSDRDNRHGPRTPRRRSGRRARMADEPCRKTRWQQLADDEKRD